MKPRYIPQCREVAKHWGNRMPMMCMEEAAELIQAISKMERIAGLKPEETPLSEPDRKQDLIDEMGDILIAIEALKEYYDIPDAKVEMRIEEKLARKYPLTGNGVERRK